MQILVLSFEVTVYFLFIILMVTKTICSVAGFLLLFLFCTLPLCDLFYGAGLAHSAYTVDEMNSSCSDRGNSVCWRRFPNAPGPWEGFPCGSTQGLFPDQDFSPQCGPQRRDLRQRAQAGLEGRTRPQTRLACRMDRQPLLRSLIDFCCLGSF